MNACDLMRAGRGPALLTTVKMSRRDVHRDAARDTARARAREHGDLGRLIKTASRLSHDETSARRSLDVFHCCIVVSFISLADNADDNHGPPFRFRSCTITRIFIVHFALTDTDRFPSLRCCSPCFSVDCNRAVARARACSARNTHLLTSSDSA